MVAVNDVCHFVQRGSHLDFSQALADAVRTASERAEEIDDSLKTFMFVIPKVGHLSITSFCHNCQPSYKAGPALKKCAEAHLHQRIWGGSCACFPLRGRPALAANTTRAHLHIAVVKIILR